MPGVGPYAVWQPTIRLDRLARLGAHQYDACR